MTRPSSRLDLQQQWIGHQPMPAAMLSRHTVRSAEQLLGDWFGAEVVLTSSGRAAILLYLSEIGLNRYRDTVALPRLISACVLEAVIRRAFPRDAATPDAPGGRRTLTLLYHQYGLPQTFAPTGEVLEDICHGLFSGPDTGQRPWRYPAAVFSLPKFLGVSGMIGGLVVRDRSLAEQLRVRRNAIPLPRSDERRQMGQVFRDAGTGGSSSALEHLYLTRLLTPQIGDDELGGVPDSLDDLRAIGHRRQAVLQHLVHALPPDALPPGWDTLVLSALPFALPLFAPPDRLARVDAVLRDAGVLAGIYQIDIDRDMTRPNLRSALLLPCHHQITPHLEHRILSSLKGLE